MTLFPVWWRKEEPPEICECGEPVGESGFCEQPDCDDDTDEIYLSLDTVSEEVLELYFVFKKNS